MAALSVAAGVSKAKTATKKALTTGNPVVSAFLIICRS